MSLFRVITWEKSEKLGSESIFISIFYHENTFFRLKIKDKSQNVKIKTAWWSSLNVGLGYPRYGVGFRPVWMPACT